MCIFCKIVKKEIPSTVVYEDEKTIAFLDIHPVHKGHTLVLPKRHAETFTDLEPEEVVSLMKQVHKIAKALIKTTKADGYNIIINNNSSAGQEVPHVHVHIIPRFNDDGRFYHKREKESYTNNEAEIMKEKIEANL